MTIRRRRTKGRAEKGGFLMLRHDVLQSENFRKLSNKAVRLLVDIGSQYRGHNNGDLCAAWTIMAEKGWKSRATLHSALNELLYYEFIVKTRQGGRNRCNLFALTWDPIHECDGKLDIPERTVAKNEWRDVKPDFGKSEGRAA